jgi:NTE family protein
MKKIGLVLTGGGGKGAYQIGVWKALREFGFDKNVHAVAGTSVGALNAALFVQGDINVAENVWLNISPEKILTPDLKRILIKASKYLSPPSLSRLALISESVVGHGWFSREGLLEIIRNDVNLSLISNSDISLFAACLGFPLMKLEYLQLNGLSQDEMESVLLATSAIPFIFDPVQISGKMYWDGGFPIGGDNVPVKPVYEQGCDLIIAIHLNRGELIDNSQFPNAQIIEIVPQLSKGGFFNGTIDFSREGAKRRMDMG